MSWCHLDMAQYEPNTNTMSTHSEVICWYTPEEWSKVKATSVDGDLMGLSYDDWLRRAEALGKEFESRGAIVSKVHVKADALLAFARRTNASTVNEGVRIAFTLSPSS